MIIILTMFIASLAIEGLARYVYSTRAGPPQARKKDHKETLCGDCYLVSTDWLRACGVVINYEQVLPGK